MSSSSLAPTNPGARENFPEDGHEGGSAVVAPEIVAVGVGASRRVFLERVKKRKIEARL